MAAHDRDAGDPDLTGLAGERATAVALVLRRILHDVYFDQVNHDLRLPRYGGDYDVRPFPLPVSGVDTHEMKRRLREAVKASRHTADAALARRIQRAFALFMFGESLPRDAVADLFDGRTAAVDDALAVGFFVHGDGRTIRTNGLSLFSRKLLNGQVVHAFADTPPQFDTRRAEPRVYAGADSYQLMARVAALDPIAGVSVEMGSGSGIQLIAALKVHAGITKAIGVERDRRAMHASLFNAALNGVDAKLAVVGTAADLERALDGHAVALAMTNPPFLAMPQWIDVDAEDCATLKGWVEVRETAHGCQADLRTLFPAAGWGGDDGLVVTKEFVDTLIPFLADDSRIVIYSQFAGAVSGPSFLRDDIRRRAGLRFEFEPAAERPISAGEAAASVARLIVAALMARRHPQRLRVAVRQGGPEHALQARLAARIEARYHQRGISAFHDGFVVLTARPLWPEKNY